MSESDATRDLIQEFRRGPLAAVERTNAMPIHASTETLAEVAALLCPIQSKTPRQIHAALPLVSPQTVYNALYLLVQAGQATFEGEMGKRRYRLVAK